MSDAAEGEGGGETTKHTNDHGLAPERFKLVAYGAPMTSAWSAGKLPCERRSGDYLPLMSIAELRSLPRDEKLRIIEALWSDLASDEESLESPAWHAEELRKTEVELEAGRVEVVDWEEAKKELRMRFE